MNVTIYKNIYDVSNGYVRNITFVLDRIKNGSISKDLIEKIRLEEDHEKRNELKKHLPCILFQGIFSKRKDKEIDKFSGLMPLDFDGLNSLDELNELKSQICIEPFVLACFISPSHNGIKAIVKVPSDGSSNYKERFKSLQNYFSEKSFDVSSSNISRVCYESYDPEIYVNLDAEIYNGIELPELEEIGQTEVLIPVTSDNRIIRNLTKWFNSKYGMNKGSRNSNLYKLAIAFNDFGINKTEALNELGQYQSEGFDAKEIESVINSAYKKTSTFKTKFFEDSQIKARIEKQIRTGKKVKDIQKAITEVSPEKIQEVAENIKENIAVNEFWYYDDNEKLKLSPHKYKYYLEQNNFSKFFPSDGKTFTFIKIKENIVEETSPAHIKDFVLTDLLNRDGLGYSVYDFMALNSKYFTPEFLSMLDSKDVKMNEDNKDCCFLYYKNKVIKITTKNIEHIDYFNIDGYVWSNQIIDRDFRQADHHDSEFRKFIWLICGQDEQKYNTFKSVLGYLMHSFKTSANNKAVILNDAEISENPNGGSGKGLFCNALSHLKKMSFIDGKTFEFTKSFPYQTVTPECQVLVFDDVKKSFSFESLFSLITEGITLEYKGQDAIKLPVQKSPKIVITTNYTVGGVGGSFERRKFEIEMSSYFNSKHTPLDEFNKLLFDEWDDMEWSRFDNYMINCCQYFLTNGLVNAEFDNIELRKFIKDTSFEFYEYTQNHDAFDFDLRINKGTAYTKFIEEYPDLKKWFTQKRFKMSLESYCSFYGYIYKEGNYPGIGRYFEICKEDGQDNLDNQFKDETLPF
jgi:hypothetical protein